MNLMWKRVRFWAKWLFYESVIPLRIKLIIVVLALAGCLALVTDQSTDFSLRQQNIFVITEVIFPMLAAIFTGNLILCEREQHTIEFLSIRISLVKIWSIRMAVAIAWLHLLLLSELLILNWVYIDLNLGESLLSAIGPTLGMVGIVSFTGVLSREANVGYVIGGVWWGLCLLSPGMASSFFGYFFFLFLRLFNPQADWIANKVFLSSIGLFLIVISGWLINASKERLIT